MAHNPAFDGLRALAVMAVLAFHCGLVPGGFVGVDVFFVLSGFLITGLLWREADGSGTVQFGRFFARRVLRLTPALLVMLSTYVALAPFVFPGAPAGRDALLAGLYLSDYSRALLGAPDLLSHTWSLSVEAHFYLLWPIVVIAAARLFAGQAAHLFLLAFLAASLLRMMDLGMGLDWDRTYYRSDTRLSGLLLGAAIAVLPWRPRPAAAGLIGMAGLAVLALASLGLRWGNPVALIQGGLLVDLASAAIVLALASGSGMLGRALSWSPLAKLGLISYGVYLWHYPIARLARDHLDPWTASAVVAAASMVIAALSYRYVELPARAWGRQRLEAAAKTV